MPEQDLTARVVAVSDLQYLWSGRNSLIITASAKRRRSYRATVVLRTAKAP